MSKIFKDKVSRRQFLWLGGSTWLSLPTLVSLMPRHSWAQTNQMLDQPFFINVPVRETCHGKDFFGNLPESQSLAPGWTQLGSRCRAKAFDGNNVSPIFNFLSAEDQALVRPHMTLIAGTYNGYQAGSHDASLCSTLFSHVNYDQGGATSPNFQTHKNATIDQRIKQAKNIEILNTTLLGHELYNTEHVLYGRVGSCDINGTQSPGIFKLNTLSNLIFGAPGGSPSTGNTGPVTTTTVDKRAFFEHALSGITRLVSSSFGQKLSKVDKLSLNNIEQQLVSVRENYKSMTSTSNGGNSSGLGYDVNVGEYSISQCQTAAQTDAYIDGMVNMIVASVVTGKYQWVNVGNYAHFIPQFLDGVGFGNKMYPRYMSHEASHHYVHLGNSQNDSNIQQLKNMHRRMYDVFVFKIVKKLASIDHPQGGKYIDRGIVQTMTEHASGSYHDTGSKNSQAEKYYGLKTAWFGGLKGENPHRGKTLDFRREFSQYKRPLAFKHFLGRSIFNAFGVTNDSQIKTSNGHHVGYYSTVNDNTPGWDPDHMEIVTKSLKQLTT